MEDQTQQEAVARKAGAGDRVRAPGDRSGQIGLCKPTLHTKLPSRKAISSMVLASVSPALPICYLSTSPAQWLTSSVHSLGHSAVDLAVQGPPTAHSTLLHGSSCMSSCKRAPLSGSPSLMPVNCRAGRGQTSDLTFAEQSMRCDAMRPPAGQGGRAGGGRREAAAPLLPERELI